MADEIKEDRSSKPLDACPLILTSDLSKPDDSGVLITTNDNPVDMHKNNVSLKKVDLSQSHPSFSKNGIAVHREKSDVETDHDDHNEAMSCDVTSSSKFSHINSINLLETSDQQNCQKQDGLDIEYVDSGVHSGTENGSDAKSSSSSPGLSTESSVHDLCDKKCVSNDNLSKGTIACHQNVSDSNSSVDLLADDISKTVTLSTDDATSSERDIEAGIEYVVYASELQMPDIMKLITKDLSEPYSIYTYRYFIHNWPRLCFLAMDDNRCVGAIVCKLDMHKKLVRRGYIAMLAVDQNCRRKRIGSHLVLKAIGAMMADDCDEVVLETEITNKAALRLYENLGFVRDKRLFRYYLNGVDALRLKLWLR